MRRKQNADALTVTIKAMMEKFGGIPPDTQRLNFGGGHYAPRVNAERATSRTG